MSYCKISVIIPAYNAEQTIIRLLESIVQQTFSEFEVIIVDDGSEDMTSHLVRQFIKNDLRIKLIQQLHSGVSAARNNGINNSSGKYIVFCDADDVIDFDFLDFMYKGAVQNSHMLYVCGYSQIKCNITESFCTTSEKILRLEKEEALSHVLLLNGFQGYVWNKIFLRDAICKYKLKFDEEIVIWEDLLFVVQYIYCYCTGVVYDSTPKYRYIENKNSVLATMSKKFDESSLDELKVCDKIEKLLISKYTKAYKTLKLRKVASYIGVIRNMNYSGYKDKQLSRIACKYIRQHLCFFLIGDNNIMGGWICKRLAPFAAISPSAEAIGEWIFDRVNSWHR